MNVCPDKMSKRTLLLALVVSLALSEAYRLPKDVIPNHYDLEIVTNLANDNSNYDFNGKVWIEIKCINPTNKITLHSKSLKIDEKEVLVKESDKTGRIPVENIKYDVENDFLTLKLKESLKKDRKYELYVPFDGALNEDLLGYYRSSYVDVTTKEKRWLATTQFEPTSARKAFPCFDEPAMKATFNISLGRNEKYSSISNMPIAQTVPMEAKKGWYWDKYEKSVPMSTYLVAYIVSDFDYKTSKLKENNISFRVWTRKDAIDQVEYANEVGPLFLQFFEKFFDIAYPLPKQDMVAVPDFSAGAMENWGLITYREGRLLYDPKVSSLASKESIASVIAHELAHQWFGNLVTMEWWSDLWLNEGFATYMSALALDDVHPSWRSLMNGDVSNLLSVFSLDALESSHPVSVPVGNPKEIQEIFDTITYQKGSSVIRMMYNFLGKEQLRRGVSDYLRKHKYKNAEQDDLWAALTDVAHNEHVLPQNLTVKTIMDSWTVQTGYPVITVRRQDGKESVEIKQKRFISTKVHAKNESPCWWVPITYTNQDERNFNDTKAKHWLSCPAKAEIIDGVAKPNKWFIFNVQFTGIYRVNYDEDNWKLLIKTLNSDSYVDIALANRVQLIEDAAKLAWTGEIEYDILFDLLKYMEREVDYLPWSVTLNNLARIETFFQRTSSYGLLREYMRKLLTPIYKKVGGFEAPKDDARLDQIKLQRTITAWACSYEIGECIEAARTMFKNYQKNPQDNPIPKDFRSIVYHYALQYGGEQEWDFLWNQYNKSNVATEKSLILNSLGHTREIWLLQRYLEWSLDENHIRKQDSWLTFISVANNPVGYQIAKEFLLTRVKDIYKSINPRFRTFYKYLYVIAKYITTDKDYNEFKSFIATNDEYFAGAKQSVEQSLEAARLNAEWTKKNFDTVKKLLAKY